MCTFPYKGHFGGSDKYMLSIAGKILDTTMSGAMK